MYCSLFVVASEPVDIICDKNLNYVKVKLHIQRFQSCAFFHADHLFDNSFQLTISFQLSYQQNKFMSFSNTLLSGFHFEGTF